MIDRSQLQIRKLIMHEIDHRAHDAPILADEASPVPEEVASLLTQWIISNREHKLARAARFVKTSDRVKSTSELCDDILTVPDNFVPRSKDIATRLFDSVDRRVSAGDLLVCTFVESHPQELAWLALLKVDPEDGFVGERQEVNGQTRVVLRRVPQVLPRRDIQKAAFILPPSLRMERDYDLVVLDQQAVRYGGKRLASSYFTRDFLQCEFEQAQSELQVKDLAQRRVEAAQIKLQAALEVAQDRFHDALEAVRIAETNDEKKKTLEDLAAKLVESIPGLSVHQLDLRSSAEEVDLLVQNHSVHPFWREVGTPFMVECKNWSTRVGAPQIRDLKGKLEDKGIRTAFLVCREGVTGTSYKDGLLVIRQAKAQGRFIVPITDADLEEVTAGSEAPHDMFARAYYGIFDI